MNDRHEAPAPAPRLRFPEFRDAGEWETKTLRTLGSFFRGLTYSANEVSEEGLLVLRSSNIQEDSLVLDKDLVFVNKSCPDALLLQNGDVIICMSNGSKALVGKSAEYRGGYDGHLTAGAFCSIFRPSIKFAKLIFQTQKYSKFVSVSIGGGNINNLKNSDLEDFEHPIPKTQLEQQKIAACLSSLDELITAEAQKLDLLKTHKKGLMQHLFPRTGESTPRLRFPEFRDAPAWEAEVLSKVIKTISPPKKIPTTQFCETGLFPIIDQSQSPIAGWTDDRDAVVDKGLPLIIFGDHTCILKIATTPFAQGADGIKIFGCSSSININYLYQYLHSNPLKMEEYKRHFSILKAKEIFYPTSWEEQQKIAACLSSLDELITAEAQKLDLLKTHKKGLMQSLFPALSKEGE